ncbi:MAG: DUF5662 family protein [Succinivibrionaceae bacterium]
MLIFFKYIKNALFYGCQILLHKSYVGYYCFHAKIYVQGITHDLSKFSPIEFFNHIKNYEPGISPVAVAVRKYGYSIAFEHHKAHNPHHFNYWIIDKNARTCKIMKTKYVLELVCDYLGAAKAYHHGKITYQEELEWWFNFLNKYKPVMHPSSIKFATKLFSTIAEENNLKVLTNKEVIQEYSQQYEAEKDNEIYVPVEFFDEYLLKYKDYLKPII